MLMRLVTGTSTTPVLLFVAMSGFRIKSISPDGWLCTYLASASAHRPFRRQDNRRGHHCTSTLSWRTRAQGGRVRSGGDGLLAGAGHYPVSRSLGSSSCTRSPDRQQDTEAWMLSVAF